MKRGYKVISLMLVASLLIPSNAIASSTVQSQKDVVTIPNSLSRYQVVDKDGNSVVVDFEFEKTKVDVVITTPAAGESQDPIDKKVITIPIKQGGSGGGGGSSNNDGGSSNQNDESSSSEIVMPIFKDTINHWARDDIQFMAFLGLIRGYPDGTFRPERTISKAEFAALLSRAIQISETKPQNYDYPINLLDVKEQDWFSRNVKHLVGRGNIVISEIYPKLKMNPQSPILREEVAYWLANDTKNKKSETKPFKDDSLLQFKEQVYRVSGAGLMKGFPDGSFGPYKSTTRAQAASMIVRLLRDKGIVK